MPLVQIANGGDPPCHPCSDCGGCIHNQFLESELEKWYQNRVLEDELHARDITIKDLRFTTEMLRLQREIERKDKELAYLVTELAKYMPCEIDKKELAEIAKGPFTKEYTKQVDEIVKKHFPEIASFMKS
uniref:Putative ovule protein n=1 Tax=Solanum chacoense TaxID=4108 RepID=A0A0V0GYQ1_SOLCH